MKATWKVKYSYNPEFDILNSISFDMIVDCEDDEFNGIATDEEFTELTKESPAVTGFIDGDMISFTVVYPFEYVLHDDDQYTFDRSKPGHEIVYTGYFNPNNGHWEGDWEMVAGEIRLTAEESELDMIHGSWRMERS